MQDGPEPGGDRGDSRRRRQYDRFPRRTWMGGAIAFMAPAQQPVAQDEPRIAAFCDHRAVRQVFEAPAPCPLPPRVPIDTFPMPAAVHVGDARRMLARSAIARRPGVTEPPAGAEAAFEARPVSRRERGRFVEEEEF